MMYPDHTRRPPAIEERGGGQKNATSRVACALLVFVAYSITGCFYPASDTLLEGFACTETGECVDGYVCRDDICVRDLADGGPLGDGGVVDRDGGVPLVPPLGKNGALSGAARLQSTRFRLDLRVGGTPVVGQSQSAGFRVQWGTK